MTTLKQGGRADAAQLAPGQRPGEPAAGTWHVLDQSGKRLGQVDPIGITRAGEVAELPGGVEALFGRVIQLMRVSAASLGWTVAIGLDGDATPLPSDGDGAGVGIYVAPGGDVGLYLSAQHDMGLLEGITGTTRSTAVVGGPENLEGFSYAVSAEGLYGVGPGVAVLFGEQGDFLGLATKVGIGVEFGIYVGLSFTKLSFEGRTGEQAGAHTRPTDATISEENTQ
jgi:hypothetical protein